jgi:hypothetical protein
MFLSVNLVCAPPFQILDQLNDFHGMYVYHAVRGHPSAVEFQEKLRVVPLIVQSLNFVSLKNAHLLIVLV